VGHATTSEDMTSLQDVYEELRAPKACKASYQLQFLWRDLTSDDDAVVYQLSYQAILEMVNCEFVIYP